MRKTVWYLFLLLLVVTIYGLGTFTGPRLQKQILGTRGAVDKFPPSDSRSALGRLQPSGGIISIVAQPGDRIERLYVHQGQWVAQGYELVKLASYEDREQELKLARDTLADAQRQRAAITKSLDAKRAELDVQESSVKEGAAFDRKVQDLKVKGLEGQVKIARTQLTALQQLTPGVADVPRERMDKAKGAVEQYDLELKSALDGLKAIDAKLKTQLEGLKAQRDALVAESNFRMESVPISSLEQKVKLCELGMERSFKVAPVDGTVLKIFNREGDSTGPEPILQIAAGEGMVAVAEVYATDVQVLLGWLKDGPLRVEVSSPALGDPPLTGVLTNPKDIAPGVARNAVTGFSPRADSDRRIVEVRVKLDEKSAARAAEFIGLDVTVMFSPPAKK